MRPLLEVLQLSAEYLEKQGVDSARREAEEVIAECIGVTRTELYMEHDRPLNEDELTFCRSHLARRAKGEPLPYIFGYVDFLECRINVNKSVLIPRQETEILAEMIACELEEIEDISGKVLVDICTGSGCLGISLKKRLSDLQVILTDISKEALMVAQENTVSNEVDLELLEGDLLTPLQGRLVDYVVCNPPYVSEEEYRHLSREVKDFEPKGALVASHDGLNFYDRLNQELPDLMNPGGKVWLEFGYKQGADVRSIFSNKNWINGQILKDWSGKERFCTVQKA